MSGRGKKVSFSSGSGQRLEHKCQPSIVQDSSGLYITCSCDSLLGKFYLSKFDESKKTLPKCVLFSGNWYSPTEVEGLAGKKARKWKQSLLHLGKPLSDYNLFCMHVIQGSDQHVTSQDVACDLRSVSDSVSTVNNNSVCSSQLSASHNSGVANVSVSSPSSVPSSLNSGFNSSSHIVNPVLAFLKAFRLRGDKDSLKSRICERFSGSSVSDAKKLLWDCCSHSFVSLDLQYSSRRDSDNHSQLVADTEDLLFAFDALDSIDAIPLIFCEASDLFLLPPVTPDPLAEQVEKNSQVLSELKSTVQSLEKRLLSCTLTSHNTLGDSSNSGSESVTYANKVASYTHHHLNVHWAQKIMRII